MGFRNVVFYSLFVLVVFYTASRCPAISDGVFRCINAVLLKFIHFFSFIGGTTGDYCADDLEKDVIKVAFILFEKCNSIYQVKDMHTLEAVYNDAMSYTKDGLNHVLSFEEYLLPQHITANRDKLIDINLLVLLIVMVCISYEEISMDTFFLLVSCSVLVYYMFGLRLRLRPLWNILFCSQQTNPIGLCYWD